MPTIDEMRAYLAEKEKVKEPTIEEMRSFLAKDKSFNPNQPFKSDGSSYIDKFRNNNEKSGEKAQAQLESFGNSLALGYAPNLQALVSASLDPNYFVDKKLESQGIKIEQPSWSERYIADRDQNAARQEQQRKDFPVSTGGASLAGGVIGGIATSPLIPIPMAAKAGTPLLQLVAKGAGVGALQGAGYGAVSNPGETKGEISPLQLGDRASNALTGAEFGAVIGGGAPLVSAAINKAPAAGRYLLSKVGGVDPEISKTYWNNMDRINNSKTPAELKDISDDLVGRLYDDVQAKKIDSQNAQLALKEYKDNLVIKFNEMGVSGKQAIEKADELLKSSHRDAIVRTSSDVASYLPKMKEDVIKLSDKATDLLASSGVKLETAPIINTIDDLMSDLSIKLEGLEKNTPVGEKAKQAYNYLKSKRDVLSKGQFLPATEAKKLIQQLQQDTDYNIGSAQFNDSKNAAIKFLSGSINQTVKGIIPEYGQAMIPVAEKAALLEQANKHFKDALSSQNTIGNIGSLTKAEPYDVLKQLGKVSGQDYIGQATKESLPEYSALSKLQAKQTGFYSGNIKKSISSAMENSPLNINVSKTTNALTRAQENLEPYTKLIPKSVGSQAERLIKTLGDGKTPIDTERMFTELGKLSGTDFVQAMKDQKVLQTFNEASKRNPAIKTIMSLVGAAVGYHYGGYGGLTTGVGSTVAANAFGPKAVKSILDGAKKLSMNPTVKNLTTLDLPPEVKANWANMIKQGVIRNGPPEGKK